MQARFDGSIALRTRSESGAAAVTSVLSTLVNSAFVQGLLVNGELSEVRPSDVTCGDLAFYFAGNELKHAGRVTSTSPDLMIQSKWGGNEVHEHPLWEIPLEHGDQVRFFKRPRPEWILDRLEAGLRSPG